MFRDMAFQWFGWIWQAQNSWFYSLLHHDNSKIMSLPFSCDVLFNMTFFGRWVLLRIMRYWPDQILSTMGRSHAGFIPSSIYHEVQCTEASCVLLAALILVFWLCTWASSDSQAICICNGWVGGSRPRTPAYTVFDEFLPYLGRHYLI